MLDQLRTFRLFQSLSPASLAAVERHAGRLRLPEQRWLRRRGQPLTRELFLLDGAVAVHDATGVNRITPRDVGAESLNAFVSDTAEMSTASAVDVVAVDLAPIRSVLASGTTASTPVVSTVDAWMHALLEGPVMRWFPPTAWARVLRAGKPHGYRQGELILAAGEVAAGVFVVGEGVAAMGEQRFGPGDFFAEQSALMQLPLPRDAIMTTDGVVIAFATRDILDLADEYQAPRLDPAQQLDLDSVPAVREDDALAGLAPGTPVTLCGGDAGRRLVVAARLMREGFAVV
ncbi:MAG: cyclic nucleotide-binding domain-containing protein [Gammaproteobacteria bacterium]|nr:cyclic nucleotide-binding domain-containing protein [Gammaproteobacteria bacterium]